MMLYNIWLKKFFRIFLVLLIFSISFGQVVALSASEVDTVEYRITEDILVVLPKIIDSPEKLRIALNNFLKAYIECVRRGYTHDFIMIFGHNFLKRDYEDEILKSSFLVNSNPEFLKIVLDNVDKLVDRVKEMGFGTNHVDFYLSSNLFAYISMTSNHIFFGIAPVKMHILLGIRVTINEEANPPILLTSDRTGDVGTKYIIVRSINITSLEEAIRIGITFLEKHYNVTRVNAIVNYGIWYQARYVDSKGRYILYPCYMFDVYSEHSSYVYSIKIWANDGSVDISKGGYYGITKDMGENSIKESSEPLDEIMVFDYLSKEVTWIRMDDDNENSEILHLVTLIVAGTLMTGAIGVILIRKSR